jgi:hypothetical protein
MDRRATFFLVAALVCVLLVPVTDDDRWVPIVTAIVYVLLALASFLDARSRKHSS